MGPGEGAPQARANLASRLRPLWGLPSPLPLSRKRERD